MRIDLLALGSQGDVQPFVALGLGLQGEGHRVRIVTLGRFDEFVRGHGLEHVSIGSSPQDIAATAAGKDWVERRHGVIGFLRGFVRVARALVEEGLAAYWRVCQDAEVLVTSASGLLLAVNVAEKMGLPVVRAQFAPSVPTRYDWNGRTSPAIAARVAWESFVGAAFRLLIWQGLRRPTNRARRELLGLPSLPLQEPFAVLNRRRIPLLDGYSPAVVVPPPDWDSWVHVTGYWFLDTPSTWRPAPALADFLRSGPPPVFVGFGSTPFPDPGAATDHVVRALARAGQRGIVVAGKSGLATGRLSDDVLSVDSVPHNWLLPQVCAAVHHGGAGVTGATLRAGLPSVVVPIFGDQPFWGQRVHDLGAGPRPIPARRLREEGLADALRLALAADVRRRAAALGERIRAEDGVARGVEVVQRHLGVPFRGLTAAHAAGGRRP
jgi:UDP:flavonoid glycosyltransferase YjiC (YdhE family)